MQKYDVIIIGAGAAGLMCAWQAGVRGLKVAVLEHTGKIAEKIRISGGGRCNFTNLHNSPQNFISNNPHFCKSALRRFTPHDFIALLEERNIAYHEKQYDPDNAQTYSRGQLFCDKSAGQIINMLKEGVLDNGGHIHLKTKVSKVARNENSQSFTLRADQKEFTCKKLVIATGGLSIPKIGASNFGYELAKQFELDIIPPTAALVPLTFDDELLEQTKKLSGITIDARVSCGQVSFREGLLFTHRGLSGPSILQISTYWQKAGGAKQSQSIKIDMLPEQQALPWLKKMRQVQPRQLLHNVLAQKLPVRLAQFVAIKSGHDHRIAELSDKKLEQVAKMINAWEIYPSGSEGYRTAEVTLGGIDTKDISSKTFEAKTTKGLHFIGEVLDVTGHLGGHNFQWAWASAWCCAQHL
ncbi:MAG: NAD(P)/FAD-dependent oxidoreductase [Alphaproteobacteria bacterium]